MSDPTRAGFNSVVAECEGCGSRFTMGAWQPDRRYRCGKCQALLRPVSREVHPSDPGEIAILEPGEVARVEPEKAKKPGGQRLGKVQILKELGRGGMGVVYMGRDEELRRTVAVKVLLGNGDEKLHQRFLREARVVSKLRHANIVAVHELGEQDGQAFFTMDFIEGGPLDGLFGTPGFGARDLVQLVATIARALDYAHAQGLIHRDIKPQNILVAPDRTPFLTDFGLAREVESNTRLTMSGAVMGTPTYMSPEQASGGGRVDSRTDIYSLGAVLYEGLAGRPPFEARDLLMLLDAIARQDPVPPSRISPAVPADVETICLKALAKQPDRRYQTGAEMADDLERWLRGEAISARRSGAFERGATWLKRRPAVAIGAAAGLVALLLIGVVMRNSAAKERRLIEERETEKKAAALKAREIEEEADRDRAAMETRLRDLEARLAAAATPEDADKIRRELSALKGGPEEGEWDRLAARIAALVAPPKHDYAAALAAVAAWTAPTAADEDRRTAKTRELREAAGKRFEAASREADALEKQGKLKEAADVWRALGRIGIPELARKAREAASRLDPALAGSGLPSPEVVRLRLAFDTQARAREYDAARALLDGPAGKTVPESETNELDWALSALDRFHESLRAAFTDPKDLKISTWTTEKPVTATGWSEHGVRIVTDGGALSIVALPDVRPEELARVALAAGASEESVALFWFFWDSPRLGKTEAERGEARAQNEKTARESVRAEPARARVLAFLDGMRAAREAPFPGLLPGEEPGPGRPEPPPGGGPGRPPTPEGWEELFDGNSLANFLKRDGISVANGMLLVDSTDLLTSKSWKHVEIDVDFSTDGAGKFSAGLRGSWFAREDVAPGRHHLSMHNSGDNVEAFLDGHRMTSVKWNPTTTGCAKIGIDGTLARVVSVRWRPAPEPPPEMKPPEQPPPDRPPGKPPRGPGPGGKPPR
ncbi:MAG: protein kinase [Planctomycetes bacterium]|nr:protein kinase [Planctomycetota bacterium]